MKEKAGHVITTIAIIIIGAGGLFSRLCNPEKTETQILIDYKGFWFFGILLVLVGLWIIRSGGKKK